MIKYIYLFLLLLSFQLSASENKSNSRLVQIFEMSPEIYIPSKVWDEIVINPEAKPNEAETSEGESVLANKTQPQPLYVPITVRIKEKTKGVLTDPEIEIQFPRGGGEVDLAKYVKDKQGSFHIYFDFENWETPDTSRLIYISQAKKRRIDGELFGSGCKHYYDVKKVYLKRHDKDGLLVNTTKNRYVSVLAGTYVFTRLDRKDIRLSQVTITDSRYTNLLCDQKKEE